MSEVIVVALQLGVILQLRQNPHEQSYSLLGFGSKTNQVII